MLLEVSWFSEAFSVGHGRGLQGKRCFRLHIPILVMMIESHRWSSDCVRCLCCVNAPPVRAQYYLLVSRLALDPSIANLVPATTQPQTRHKQPHCSPTAHRRNSLGPQTTHHVKIIGTWLLCRVCASWRGTPRAPNRGRGRGHGHGHGHGMLTRRSLRTSPKQSNRLSTAM